ncbi:pep-cterm sorting domain-containing protein [Anaeramoeba ignava]|uniref:Pep-cterm sorting domain-containing protein n=1 Tax=Anaeramoeba ignava TaxID=1746090 RepID=A0A9Q0LQQ8_ANAIG|nr:pep-cterm sorting domain-containing protein [Anaeramoeba ignava]
MKEYQENKMILKDVSSPILSLILNYFYSGKIEINLENAIQILIFSSKYLIDELIEICSNFIQKNFQIEFVVDVLKLSESMNFNQLLDFCYQFIFQNFEEFIKTSFFLELEENHLNSILSNDNISANEFDIFQSIIKWGKHKSNINQVPNVIDKIRFIDFTKEQIENVLKEDLIPNEISQKLIQFQNIQDEKELNQFIEQEKSFLFKSRMRFKSTTIQGIKDVNKLREWINDDEFFYKMKLGFSSKRDGFSSKIFHQKVDDKGKTLVIVKTKDNFIFGGFTQIGFTTGINNRIIPDEDCFIFSLRNDKNDRKSEKFPIQETKVQNALRYNFDYGPIFGGDIWLKENLQTGYTNFGHTYNLPNGIIYGSNEAKSYLAGSYSSWVVDELECFFI